VTLYKLDRILSGELDELITLLAAAAREEQLNDNGRNGA
jgi:protein subunit release factor A